MCLCVRVRAHAPAYVHGCAFTHLCVCVCACHLRGVVQLFNAVRKHQKKVDDQVKEASGSERKKAKIMSSVSKKDFIDVLRRTDGGRREAVKTEKDSVSEWMQSFCSGCTFVCTLSCNTSPGVTGVHNYVRVLTGSCCGGETGLECPQRRLHDGSNHERLGQRQRGRGHKYSRGTLV